MKIVETMAREMCRESCVDPDVMTYSGTLFEMHVNSETYSYFRTESQLEDGSPAWTRFVPQAKAAFEAMKAFTNDIEE